MAIRRKRKGQSTLEYVLLVTAVIVVIIGLLVAPNSPFKARVNSILNSSLNGMNTMSSRLGQSLGNAY